jgi:2-iminobutanoate/2-iminopropanoate deaminase
MAPVIVPAPIPRGVFPMKRHFSAALVLAALGTPVSAAGIERFKSPTPGPSLILQGVSVPAGSDMLFLSGQLASPIDPKVSMSASVTMEQLGDTKTQTISTLAKIKAALEAHGYKMSDVIKLTVFVAADPKLGKMDFAGMNEGFKQFFGTAENPNTVARSAFQVAALAGPAFLVEIEATAAKAK